MKGGFILDIVPVKLGDTSSNHGNRTQNNQHQRYNSSSQQRNPIICKIKMNSEQEVTFFQGADDKFAQAILKGLK
jgi:hypothetical protein